MVYLYEESPNLLPLSLTHARNSKSFWDQVWKEAERQGFVGTTSPLVRDILRFRNEHPEWYLL
jgi:hypothetical protein